jgi:hypothetical protein
MAGLIGLGVGVFVWSALTFLVWCIAQRRIARISAERLWRH